ncbi:MAG: hypothetical protein COX07_01350, partial [Bacteroidetes bacterium CG23_combo_of_CG06-09_8_20_14_all_32_9]
MTFFQKHGFTILKWLIFAVSLLFLVYHIASHQDFRTAFSKLNLLKFSDIYLLVAVFALMFANWGIEAAKWRYAISGIRKISFKRAFAAVLAGISVSLFMPNRTGEFVGRIFALPPGERIRSISASVVASFSQLLITVFCGTIALFIYYYFYPKNTLTEYGISLWIQIPASFITLLLLLIYFKIQWFTFLFEKWRFLQKYSEITQILKTYNTTILINFLLISFLRYSVFIIQFYLLLIFFGVELTFVNNILATVLTFYIMAIIPTFTLTEIGIRGSVVIIFFGFFSDSYTGIISASTLLWLINIGVPAFIGNIFIARFKE